MKSIGSSPICGALLLNNLKKRPFTLGGLKFFGGSIGHVLDSVTYEPLSIYNVLANKTFANDVQRKQPITVIDETLLRRITVNPEIFGGKPIIRGMRISVELILSLLAQGETPETILTDYPDLQPDDLRACLAYAHAVIAHDKLDSVHISG